MNGGTSLYGVSGSNWHYEGPRGRGGHNLRRPGTGTRLNQVQGYDAGRNYNLKWKTGDKITSGDIWTNNVAKQAGGKGHHPFSHAYEVIDWDSYNRDNQYQKWLRETGKKSFTSLGDLHEAEGWMSGHADRRRLEEDRIRLERERLQREEIERIQEAARPQYIDIQGAQVPVGGIGQHVNQLQSQWDQYAQQQLATQRSQWDTRYQQQQQFYQQQAADVRTAYDAQLERQRLGFADRQTAWDQRHEARIQDLTSHWDQQQGQWQSQTQAQAALHQQQQQAQAAQHQQQQQQWEARTQGFQDEIARHQQQQRQQNEMMIQQAQRDRMAAAYAGNNPDQGVQGVYSGKVLQNDPRWRFAGGSGTRGFKRGSINTAGSINV